MSKQQKYLIAENYRQLFPDHFYRLKDGPEYFGYRHSRLAALIETGEIPAPISLTDSGRAKGWFGRTILAWQAEREAAAKAKALASREVA